MLLSNMELLATAPGGVAKLRELILTLAVQGKLVSQDPADEPAGVLLQKIRAEKDRLIAEGKIKRDKPLAEIAGEEKPFELPQGWEWVRCDNYFLELCTGPFGSMIHQEDYVRDGVPLINPSHMIGGRIIHDPRVTIKVTDAERLSAYALSAGDMVLARRGEVGRYAYVTEQEHGWLCGTGSFFVRLYSQCNREYLGLIFSDVRFRQHLQGEAVGTTMTNLNQRILLSALLALPPLAEQSRIVTRVEALMRLCDALEAKGQLEAAQHAQLVGTLLGTLTASTTPGELAANWQRVAQHFDLLLDRPEAIDALEQTLLQLAVRGLLVPQDPTDEPASALLQKIRAEKDRLITTGQIKRGKPLPPINEESLPCTLPSGWAWMRFSEVGDFRGGKTPSTQRSSYWHGEIPWITPKDMKQPLLSDSEDRVTVEALNDGLALIPSQSVLIVVRSGILRRRLPTAINLVETTINQDLKALVLVRPALAEYVQLLIQGFESFILENLTKVGTTVESVQFEAFTAQPFPFPPLAEQSRIVTRVTALRRLCADLRQRLAECHSVQARLAEALVQEVA